MDAGGAELRSHLLRRVRVPGRGRARLDAAPRPGAPVCFGVLVAFVHVGNCVRRRRHVHGWAHGAKSWASYQLGQHLGNIAASTPRIRKHREHLHLRCWRMCRPLPSAQSAGSGTCSGRCWSCTSSAPSSASSAFPTNTSPATPLALLPAFMATSMAAAYLLQHSASHRPSSGHLGAGQYHCPRPRRLCLQGFLRFPDQRQQAAAFTS